MYPPQSPTAFFGNLHHPPSMPLQNPSPSPEDQTLDEDILRTIFTYTLPPDPSQTILHPFHPPLSLYNVCKYWRQISATQHFLWRSLKIIENEHSPSDSRFHTFTQCFPLSKPHPLSLNITIPPQNRRIIPDNHPFPLTTEPSIVELTLVPCPSVADLTLLVLDGVSLERIHALPPGSFPLLTHLALSFPSDEVTRFPWWNRGPVLAFAPNPNPKIPPQLQRVVLKNCGMRHRYAPEGWFTFTFPVTSLTHLIDTDGTRFLDNPNFSGGRESASLTYAYMRDYPNLRFLHVALRGGTGSDMDQGGTWNPISPNLVTALNLEHLSLSSPSSREYPLVFSQLHTPHLRSLTLTGGFIDWAQLCALNPRYDAAFRVVQTYLSRCNNARLRRMSVVVTKTMTPRTLRMFLKAVPQLEVLEVEVVEGGGLDAVLDMLTLPRISSQRDLAEAVVPNLKTLVLTLSKYLDSSALGRFLQSRRFCAPSHRLHKLIIYTSKPKILRDKYPYIKMIQSWLDSKFFNGESLDLQFETHCTSERSGTSNEMGWMERDPEMEEWTEAINLLNSRSET